jgi:stage II sporulation protein D
MNLEGNFWFRALCLGVILPMVVLVAVVKTPIKEPVPTAPSTPGATMPTAPTTRPDSHYQIGVIFGGERKLMDIEAYLIGVVLAEMPALFQLDALKAQAVAARTYTIRRSGENNRHGDETICTDPSCCQAYIDPVEYIASGGTQNAVDRVSQAVASTAGEVLVYEGNLITATYFSCAGGITEAAAAVWGQDVPYLQPVISPGEENAPVFTDSKSFTIEEFEAAIGMHLYGDPDSWFTQVTYTAGGGVETMLIGNIPYRGTTIRSLLGLRSTIFFVSVEDGIITFHTRGFGHRVGMSQYGANAMALAGRDYQQILQYYYQGTEIVQYFDF